MNVRVKRTRPLVVVLLLVFAAISLMPFVWLVSATTKGPDDLFHYTFFAPRFSAVNYHDLFTKVPFVQYLINSVFVTSATVIVQLFFSSLAGFALAKYNFAGKKVVMVIHADDTADSGAGGDGSAV